MITNCTTYSSETKLPREPGPEPSFPKPNPIPPLGPDCKPIRKPFPAPLPPKFQSTGWNTGSNSLWSYSSQNVIGREAEGAVYPDRPDIDIPRPSTVERVKEAVIREVKHWSVKEAEIKIVIPPVEASIKIERN